jgi:hypothetical protein
MGAANVRRRGTGSPEPASAQYLVGFGTYFGEQTGETQKSSETVEFAPIHGSHPPDDLSQVAPTLVAPFRRPTTF